jgi:hypothetical protein
MDTQSSPTTDRSAAGVFVLIVVAGIALAWGASFDVPVRISRDYWRWIAPVAIPAAVVAAWAFQRALFGTWCKRRYEREERRLGRGESLMLGGFASCILIGLASMAFANVVNQVVGREYVATFNVAAKRIEHRKHTCYDLMIVNVRDLREQFDVCVSKADYDRTTTGQALRVTGRRSKYVDQLLTYISN